MALFVYNIKCAYIYAYVQEKMYIHTETHTHTKIPSQEALGNGI